MTEKSKNNIKSLIICVMTGIFIGMIIVIGKQSKEITTLKDNQIKIELKACPLCGSDEIKIKQITFKNIHSYILILLLIKEIIVIYKYQEKVILVKILRMKDFLLEIWLVSLEMKYLQKIL